MPTDSRQLEEKFDELAPESEMIIAFCAPAGSGAFEMVGSMTTGNRRPGWPSHPASGVTVSRIAAAAASQLACWETFGLQAVPYGEERSGRASLMNGAGRTRTGAPPVPSRENTIAPSGRW